MSVLKYWRMEKKNMKSDKIESRVQSYGRLDEKLERKVCERMEKKKKKKDELQRLIRREL